MRVHNSYHISLDCCNISQFEAHIRSILQMNIPTPNMYDGKMYNIISNMQTYDDVMKELKERNMANKNIFYKYYHKEPRKIRKIGHINVVKKCKNV